MAIVKLVFKSSMPIFFFMHHVHLLTERHLNERVHEVLTDRLDKERHDCNR